MYVSYRKITDKWNLLQNFCAVLVILFREFFSQRIHRYVFSRHNGETILVAFNLILSLKYRVGILRDFRQICVM